MNIACRKFLFGVKHKTHFKTFLSTKRNISITLVKRNIDDSNEEFSEEEEENEDNIVGEYFPQFDSCEKQVEYFDILNQTTSGKLRPSEVKSMLFQRQIRPPATLQQILDNQAENRFIKIHSIEFVD